MDRKFLKMQIEAFRKKPTWNGARNHWLYCQKHGYPVDPEIEDFFINKLTADNEMWMDSRESSMDKKLEDDIDFRIYRLKEFHGMEYGEIALELNEKGDGKEHTHESVRKRYDRIKK